MKLEKSYFTSQFNENILNCRSAQKHERYETAAFYRGCSQGMLTAMYWFSLISEDEYNNILETTK